MPLGKLIKVERTISIHKRTDNSTLDDLIEEINVDSIPLDVLKSIVNPNEDDPLLYDGYPLTVVDLNKLNQLIQKPIIPDFIKYEYYLLCTGIYE